MLILGRKDGEKIHIGNDITISIENITKGMVKIGITAPKDIVILRGELKEKVKEANTKASLKPNIEQLKSFSKLLKK
jgi:carbon storage regulator